MIASHFLGKTVSILYDFIAVRGSWSLWNEWSNCSVTCENGTQTRTRDCNHPPPNYGGTYCPGDGVQYKPCELPMCPSK